MYYSTRVATIVRKLTNNTYACYVLHTLNSLRMMSTQYSEYEYFFKVYVCTGYSSRVFTITIT
jgi:hypothetical protein